MIVRLLLLKLSNQKQRHDNRFVSFFNTLLISLLILMSFYPECHVHSQIHCEKITRDCKSNQGVSLTSKLDHEFCVGVCMPKQSVSSGTDNNNTSISGNVNTVNTYGVIELEGVGGPWGFNESCGSFNEACLEACKSEGKQQSQSPTVVYCVNSSNPSLSRYGSCACSGYQSPASFPFQYKYIGTKAITSTLPPLIPETYQTREHSERACAISGGTASRWKYNPYPAPDLSLCLTKGVPDIIIDLPSGIPTWKPLTPSPITPTCEDFEKSCNLFCSAFVNDSTNNTVNDTIPITLTVKRTSPSYSICSGSRKDGSVTPYGQCMCIDGKLPQSILGFQMNSLVQQLNGLNEGQLIPYTSMPEKSSFFDNSPDKSSSFSDFFQVHIHLKLWLFSSFIYYLLVHF